MKFIYYYICIFTSFIVYGMQHDTRIIEKVIRDETDTTVSYRVNLKKTELCHWMFIQDKETQDLIDCYASGISYMERQWISETWFPVVVNFYNYQEKAKKSKSEELYFQFAH